MLPTGKGCRQPEGRLSAGARNITWVGNCSKKGEFGVTAEPRKKPSAEVQETFLCVASYDLSSVGMGNLHPGVFGKEFLCVIFSLPRNSSFFRTPLTWQAGGWGQAEGFSCPSLYSKNAGIRLEDAGDLAATKVTQGWQGGHPVTFIFLSFLYSPSQIISWCDAAGSSILVHKESWSRAQGEGKCEGEIGERFIGEDIFKGGTEWEGVSLSTPARWGTCPLSLLRWFTKNTRVY